MATKKTKYTAKPLQINAMASYVGHGVKKAQDESIKQKIASGKLVPIESVSKKTSTKATNSKVQKNIKEVMDYGQSRAKEMIHQARSDVRTDARKQAARKWAKELNAAMAIKRKKAADAQQRKDARTGLKKKIERY